VKRGVALGLACAASLTAVATARAHEVGLSRGEYVVDGDQLEAEVIFARKELIGLVAGLDANHDGALTQVEIDASRDAIAGAVVGRFKVDADGAPCSGSLDRAGLVEQDGVAVRAVYRCPAQPRKLGVALTFFDDVPFGHRHLAHAMAGKVVVDRVLSQRSPSFSIDVPPDASRAPSREPTTSASGAAAPSSAGSPFVRGGSHALLFWQGPLVLLGAMATAVGRRSALVAAAVYVASVVLGFAIALRGFVPSPSALAIATSLSLVFVGVDAARPAARDPRGVIAASFGAVHGIAHASALGPTGVADAFTALLGVVGVTGAIAAVAIVLAPRVAPSLPGWRRAVPVFGVTLAVAGAIGVAGALTR
jgi:hydrogenase/urease accessory protein HupE